MPDNLLQIAFYVLCATAAGGLLLSMFVLGGREAPKPVAIGHGLAGVLAVLALIGAAGGGLYLAHRHPRNESPEFIVAMHALAAVTGVIVVGVLLSRAG